MLNLLLDNPPGPDGRFNVGDDIQAIAASKLMPRVDDLVIKEEISNYKGAISRIILNGWFMHNPNNWPPPNSLVPLVISIHVSIIAAKKMLTGLGKEFFLNYQPIGCRDKTTLELLRAENIQAYLSSCLTLTLNRNDFIGSDNSQTRSGIVITDPLYKLAPKAGTWEFLSRLRRGKWNDSIRFRRVRSHLIKQIVGPDQIQNITYTGHSCVVGDNSYRMRKQHAFRLLQTYAKARLVITSRIHCALPCLAFGTPVMFIDAGLENGSERARLDGLIDLFHCIKFDLSTGSIELPINYVPGDLDSIPSNKLDFLGYRDSIIERCKSFFDY